MCNTFTLTIHGTAIVLNTIELILLLSPYFQRNITFRGNSRRILASMSAADLLVGVNGLICNSFHIVDISNHEFEHFITESIFDFLVTISVFSITLLTGERFFAIFSPNKRNIRFRDRLNKLIIVVSWIVCIGVSATVHSIEQKYGVQTCKIIIALEVFICTAIILVAHVLMWRKLHQHHTKLCRSTNQAIRGKRNGNATTNKISSDTSSGPSGDKKTNTEQKYDDNHNGGMGGIGELVISTSIEGLRMGRFRSNTYPTSLGIARCTVLEDRRSNSACDKWFQSLRSNKDTTVSPAENPILWQAGIKQGKEPSCLRHAKRSCSTWETTDWAIKDTSVLSQIKTKGEDKLSRRQSTNIPFQNSRKPSGAADSAVEDNSVLGQVRMEQPQNRKANTAQVERGRKALSQYTDEVARDPNILKAFDTTRMRKVEHIKLKTFSFNKTIAKRKRFNSLQNGRFVKTKRRRFRPKTNSVRRSSTSDLPRSNNVSNRSTICKLRATFWQHRRFAERKLLILGIMVSFAFIICFFPASIFYLISGANTLGHGNETGNIMTAHIMVTCSSTLNPLVYFFYQFCI